MINNAPTIILFGDVTTLFGDPEMVSRHLDSNQSALMDWCLPATSSLLAADPGHPIVTVIGLGVFHRGHCITARLLQIALHFLTLGQRAPPA